MRAIHYLASALLLCSSAVNAAAFDPSGVAELVFFVIVGVALIFYAICIGIAVYVWKRMRESPGLRILLVGVLVLGPLLRFVPDRSYDHAIEIAIEDEREGGEQQHRDLQKSMSKHDLWLASQQYLEEVCKGEQITYLRRQLDWSAGVELAYAPYPAADFDGPGVAGPPFFSDADRKAGYHSAFFERGGLKRSEIQAVGVAESAGESGSPRKARYVLTVEDNSTREDRVHLVAGIHIKLYDRYSHLVVARYTGFMAMDVLNQERLTHWGNGLSCPGVARDFTTLDGGFAMLTFFKQRVLGMADESDAQAEGVADEVSAD